MYNRKTEDIVVAAITSNLESRRDYAVLIESEDLEAGALSRTSMVRSDRIYTLSQKIVRRKFGTLREEKFHSVIVRLIELITGGQEHTRP
jgi:mRNA interferase MazF